MRILKAIGYFIFFGLFLYVFYLFFNYLFQSVFDKKDELIKQALTLSTFVGGLFGAALVEEIRKVFNTPSLKFEGWDKDNQNIRKFDNGNMDFRIRVRNTSRSFAKGCEIKITLLDIKKEDMEECFFSDKDCFSLWSRERPFIATQTDFTKIEDEHILWDMQYKGEQILKTNISPHTSYLATVAYFKKEGQYIMIPSENSRIPRVWLKTKDNGSSYKKYKIKIVVCGENFSPFEVTKELKIDASFDFNGLNLSTLHQKMGIDKYFERK